ncbi:MAG: phosphatase PAP2 family protein [Muribaculaceae bacterium]|nr:phosphatase PAP2 family protein [Muribaculaceae bacterium]MDE5957340.1 phosphatase PAP2 family protein [Muribaculaceae bacterium]MDE6447518.1 phosphatase PAP2 family protein [Muribaculaceae bacterium]MDE7343366.1 phosphatase PAP2 family protein [Muribaculaceae bacterium]
MKKLVILLSALIVALGCAAQEVYAPVPAPLSPIERTHGQRVVGTTTDVAMIALPVATLAGVIIAQDWEGLKQGVYTAVAAGAANYILKFSVRELRPDHSNYHSFPSMHSTVGFATAAFVQRRYGWKWGAPAYAVATYTAVGRVIAKKHHWWDCVAGAAIGAASAYIFTTPWARKHEFAVAPVASETDMGLCASFTF